MLGMMNCPTSENFDFYASSPSAMRQISSSLAKLGGSPCSSELTVEGGLQKRSGSNALEVFSAVKQRPKISYTEDGRRLIDGKLASGHSTPEKMWSRLIIDSVTTTKLCRPQQSNLELENGVAQKEEGAENVQIEWAEGRPKRRFSIGSLFSTMLTKSSGARKGQKQQKKASDASTSSTGTKSL